jgi:hypothetical protein
LSPVKGYKGPAFDVTASSGIVAFERLVFLDNYFPGGNGWGVPVIQDQHLPPAVLVLRDLSDASTQTAGSATLGDVFIEDTAFGPFNFGNGQNVWARQLDSEMPVTHVKNDGATVWVLGLKTEERPTADAGVCASVMDTEQGGQTEIIGGAVMNWPQVPGPNIGACTEPQPVFIANGSRQSLAYALGANAQNVTIPIQIQETLDGGPLELLYSDGRGKPEAYPKGTSCSTIPLFIGY